MASHEQSFADEFNAYMKREAQSRGMRVHTFSLDGQDRDAGADYVITDASRFALVEFKYTESSLVSEASKPRRLKLCQKLAHEDYMRELHDKCHFIAWAQKPNMSVKINIYRKEICIKRIFGEALAHAPLYELSKRVNAGIFAENFLGLKQSSSLSLDQFEFYVSWVLTQTSGAKVSNLELVTSNVESGELFLVRLRTLKDAQNWLHKHWPPPPTHSHKPSMSG
jgi:hypothetical protein